MRATVRLFTHYIRCKRVHRLCLFPSSPHLNLSLQTRLPEDLELDFLYELVVTTRGGLYRYRMGDVVKVVRYHNKCPVFEFQYRSGRLLTGHVTEKMMYNALMTSLQCFDGKVQLEEYTCAESVLFDALPETGTEEPKGTFHVVFVELNGVLEEDEKRLLQGKVVIMIQVKNKYK